MSVVRQPFPGIFRANTNDQTAQTNLVRLSDADRVQDDRDEIAFRHGPRDTSSMFVFETNLQAARSVPSADDAVERVSPSEDGWSGLDVDQTLGQLMTETRKHLGLSRDQISEQTHIPAYYVRMIESDSYDAIPDQLYLLPFFRRYADFLGLDAQKVVSRFICDFEKAENEVAVPPAPTAYSKALSKWRQIAAAAVVGAILLPCIAWAVGAVRVAYRKQADNTLAASHSAGARPSTAIASTEARSMAATDPVRTPDAVAVSPASAPTALADTNAGSQVAPQIKPSRTGRRHRLIRHSRRWRQRRLI
ncbi:helix-turn-helix domain-containing protein [Candidatus Binatus sp.]|uniref:helix-turn-helix domain-containing protein n=2 Tax=Candidatus Binatus sp. TaxID=2811406 RepID=UPI003BAE9E34